VLNNNILTLLKRSVEAWGPRQVVVGAGRNMEIEENLADTGSQIVSWGSSLYEWAYGRYACHKPFDLRLNPEYRLRFPFIQPTETELDDIALLVLSQELRMAFHDDAYAEMVKTQWVELYARARNYVRARPVHLYDYWGPDGATVKMSQMLKPPAFVYIPQQVVITAEEVFVSTDWKTAFSHEGFDKQVQAHTIGAYPFFLLLPQANEGLADKLVGRLMVGDESKWVYSSHGTPVVLREDAPVVKELQAFTPGEGHGWVGEIHQITKGAFFAHAERFGSKMMTGVGAGSCFMLTMDGQIVGGWRVRLVPVTGTVVEVVQEFAVNDTCKDLIGGAIRCAEARMLYESIYKSRVTAVKKDMVAYEFPVTALQLMYYVGDWRAYYY